MIKRTQIYIRFFFILIKKDGQKRSNAHSSTDEIGENNNNFRMNLQHGLSDGSQQRCQTIPSDAALMKLEDQFGTRLCQFGADRDPVYCILLAHRFLCV